MTRARAAAVNVTALLALSGCGWEREPRVPGGNGNGPISPDSSWFAVAVLLVVVLVPMVRRRTSIGSRATRPGRQGGTMRRVTTALAAAVMTVVMFTMTTGTAQAYVSKATPRLACPITLKRDYLITFGYHLNPGMNARIQTLTFVLSGGVGVVPDGVRRVLLTSGHQSWNFYINPVSFSGAAYASGASFYTLPETYTATLKNVNGGTICTTSYTVHAVN